MTTNQARNGRSPEFCADAGVHVLDGEAHEVLGVGFAGIKGFAGGFGRRALGPWGEGLIKQFVREALDEALKLETALSQLRTERRVALLHYSPIAATVAGEPLEIYPYLGSSRLEEPLSRYPVDAVFHGHAHHGTPEGRTMGDVPVYNVSMVLLQENFPDRPAFRVVELPVNRRRRGRGGRGSSNPASPGDGSRERLNRRLTLRRVFPCRRERRAPSSRADSALHPAPAHSEFPFHHQLTDCEPAGHGFLGQLGRLGISDLGRQAVTSAGLRSSQ